MPETPRQPPSLNRLPAGRGGDRLRDRLDRGRDLAAEPRTGDSRGKSKKSESRAVALRYSPDEMDAPKVVATGRGQVADQIVRLALDSGVKVREDADLAEILSLLDVDQAIPPEAYVAVAEILAYVYQAEGKAVRVADTAKSGPRFDDKTGVRILDERGPKSPPARKR